MTLAKPPSHFGFVLTGETHFDPSVRDFLLLAKGFAKCGITVSVFLLTGNPMVKRHVESKLGAGIVQSCQDVVELSKRVKSSGVDCLVGDDWPAKVSMITRVGKSAGIRTLVYAIYLRGIQLLQPNNFGFPDRFVGRVIQQALHLVPFGLATARYRNLLRRADYVIADSAFTEMLLLHLYGVRASGVAYCPIDDELFFDAGHKTGSRDGALVFLGGRFDRHPVDYLSNLQYLVSRFGFVKLLGSQRFAEFVHDRLGPQSVRAYSNVPDPELRELYLTSELTYLPQLWETFGTAGPESVLCRTPIVTDISQPLIEVLGDSPVLRIGHKTSSAEKLLGAPFQLEDSDWNDAINRVLLNESPKRVAEAVTAAIEQSRDAQRRAN